MISAALMLVLAQSVGEDDTQGERVLKVLMTPLPPPKVARAIYEPSWGNPKQVDYDSGEGLRGLVTDLKELIQAGPAGLVVLTLDTLLPIEPGRVAIQTAVAEGLVPELRFAGPTKVKGQPMPEVLNLMKEVSVPPPLTKAQVRGVLKGAYGEVRNCYVSRLEANALEGRMLVEIRILADGKVEEARVYQSQLSAPEVERCVAGVVTSLRFPKLRGTPTFVVRWPFKFVKGADKPPPPTIRK